MRTRSVALALWTAAGLFLGTAGSWAQQVRTSAVMAALPAINAGLAGPIAARYAEVLRTESPAEQERLLSPVAESLPAATPQAVDAALRAEFRGVNSAARAILRDQRDGVSTPAHDRDDLTAAEDLLIDKRAALTPRNEARLREILPALREKSREADRRRAMIENTMETAARLRDQRAAETVLGMSEDETIVAPAHGDRRLQGLQSVAGAAYALIKGDQGLDAAEREKALSQSRAVTGFLASYFRPGAKRSRRAFVAEATPKVSGLLDDYLISVRVEARLTAEEKDARAAKIAELRSQLDEAMKPAAAATAVSPVRTAARAEMPRDRRARRAAEILKDYRDETGDRARLRADVRDAKRLLADPRLSDKTKDALRTIYPSLVRLAARRRWKPVPAADSALSEEDRKEFSAASDEEKMTKVVDRARLALAHAGNGTDRSETPEGELIEKKIAELSRSIAQTTPSGDDYGFDVEDQDAQVPTREEIAEQTFSLMRLYIRSVSRDPKVKTEQRDALIGTAVRLQALSNLWR